MSTKRIIEFNDQYLEVGNLAFEIVNLIKAGNSGHEIHDILIKNPLYINIKFSQIEAFIKNISSKKNENKINNSIKFCKPFFNPGKNIRWLKKLTWLFNPYIASLFIITFISTFIFFLKINNGISRHHISLEWTQIPLFYLTIFLIMFVHELGHTISAIKYGQLPKEIGIGIYFIFPVLYTDVSSIWLLNKKERVIINLGGIYLQSIISAGLVLAMFFSNSNLIKLLLISNFFMMFYSLNPFFKYDGYWIYSDVFGIKNLRLKSNELIKSIFFDLRSLSKTLKNSSSSLVIYTFFNTLFFGFQIYILILATIFNFKQLKSYYNFGYLTSGTTIIHVIITTILTSIFIYVIIQRALKLTNLKKNVKSELSYQS